MFPLLIVVGIFTLLVSIILLSSFSILDGMISAGLCIWTAFILFGHIATSGYLITLMCYFGLGSLFSFYRADKKREGVFVIMGLIYASLAIWAGCLYF